VVVISVTLVGSWGEAAVCASLTPALTVAGAAGYAFPGHVSANVKAGDRRIPALRERFRRKNDEMYFI
jgi:hypothetical protein